MTESYGEVIFINDGDGKYRINIELMVNVKGQEMKVEHTRIEAEKDYAKLAKMPENFYVLLCEYNSGVEITLEQARRFWNELVQAKGLGVTKRDISRIINQNVYFVANSFDVLQKLGWVDVARVQPKGGGRPKEVWYLKDFTFGSKVKNIDSDLEE